MRGLQCHLVRHRAPPCRWLAGSVAVSVPDSWLESVARAQLLLHVLLPGLRLLRSRHSRARAPATHLTLLASLTRRCLPQPFPKVRRDDRACRPLGRCLLFWTAPAGVDVSDLTADRVGHEDTRAPAA